MFQFVLLVDFQEYPCWYAPQHILYIYYIYISYILYIYCYSKIPQILIDFASHGPMGPWAHGDWMGHFQPATAMGWAKARRRLCLAWPGPPVACLVIASVFGHVLQSISIMRKSNKIIQNSFIIYIIMYYILYICTIIIYTIIPSLPPPVPVQHSTVRLQSLQGGEETQGS